MYVHDKNIARDDSSRRPQPTRRRNMLVVKIKVIINKYNKKKKNEFLSQRHARLFLFGPLPSTSFYESHLFEQPPNSVSTISATCSPR